MAEVSHWPAGKAQRLLTWLETTAGLERLSNTALAKMLVDEVWADMPLMTRKSDLLAEAIARLMGDYDTEEDA